MRVKIKVLILVLTLVLSTPLLIQSEVIQEGFFHVQIENDDPMMSIQVAKGDKTGVILTTAWVTDSLEGADPRSVNWIKYSEVNNLYFFVNFTALYSTKVRFRLLISGPEFYSYTSQNWLEAKYKTSSYWYKWGEKSEFFKTKGEYKVIIIAEQEKPYGGENCLASCTIRVY